MKMISREDLKQRVMGHFCGSCSEPYKDADILELGEYCCDRVSDTMAFIDELPTIEAEPVKYGRWEVRTQKDGTTIGQHNVTYCSECGYVLFTKENSFCARCGAKMDLKDGDSE